VSGGPQHYFTPLPATELRAKLVRYLDGDDEFGFRTAAGVFSRAGVDRGSRLLLEAVDVRGAAGVLDLGCGYGPVGIVLARRAPAARVTLVDINPRAVALAVENIALNDVSNAEALCGDGCAPVAGRTFDVIAMNPPIRAGRAVVLRLIDEARACLSPTGRLYLVARTSQGAQTLGRLMGERFARVAEVERGGGYRVYEASHV